MIGPSFFIFASLVLACFLIIVSVTLNAYADTANSLLFPKNSSPYGISYSKWPSLWWSWQISIPAEKHPNNGYTPQKCSINQNGPVWFLPDIVQGSEVRTCTIPADKAILFPIESGECNYGTDISQPNDQALRRCAMEGNDFAAVSVSIDGVPISDPAQYRVQSGFFNMTIPQDNFIQNKPGTWRTFVDGYWIFLKPLLAGKHTIEWKDNINNPLKQEYNHSKDVLYHINVTP